MKNEMPWQEDRFVAVFVLVLIEITSLLTLEVFPKDHYYFIICGAFNYLLVLWFSTFHLTALGFDLLKINYVALIVQFSGWILYEFYFDNTSYNSMIHTLSIIQIIRLLRIDNNELSKNNSSFNVVCSPNWTLSR